MAPCVLPFSSWIFNIERKIVPAQVVHGRHNSVKNGVRLDRGGKKLQMSRTEVPRAYLNGVSRMLNTRWVSCGAMLTRKILPINTYGNQ